MVDNGICMRCALVASAEVLDQFSGIEHYACIAVGLQLQKLWITLAKSSAMMALERRFGRPDGAKLVLEWRFGRLDDAKLALECHFSFPDCAKLALGRCFAWPDGAKSTLERQFCCPDGVKLALEWHIGRPDCAKLTLARRFGWPDGSTKSPLGAGSATFMKHWPCAEKSISGRARRRQVHPGTAFCTP